MNGFQIVEKKDLDYKKVKNGEGWSSAAGVYLMVFPNGMNYIGKSNHIGKRLISHISAFKKPRRKNDWHGEAAKVFHFKGDNFYDYWQDFVQNVDYYIYETEPGKEEELETYYLKQIALRFNQKLYYNTKYPVLTEEEWMEYMFGDDKNGT